MGIKNNLPCRSMEILFKSERLSDVHFRLKKKSGENVLVPAHKFVMASSSRVFEAMFFGISKKGSIVNIVDVSADAFSEFLQFFYLSEVHLTPKNIAEVCKLIAKYDVPQCIPICGTFLSSTATANNAIPYIELALSFNMSDKLIESIMITIIKNGPAILQSAAFRNCKQFILHLILVLLYDCEEIDILNGAISWATESLVRKGQLNATLADVRNELGTCINFIRFPLMTLKEILDCIEKYPNLLSFDEYMDLLQYIANRRPMTIATCFWESPRSFLHETFLSTDVIKDIRAEYKKSSADPLYFQYEK